MRAHRTHLIVGTILVTALLVGCRPGTRPGSPESVFTHADAHTAIDRAFGRYGPTVLSCAHQIAQRESGHYPYAFRPGRTSYYGIFQTHGGFQGSADRAAVELANLGEPGHHASLYDPFVAALVATYAFDAAGGSFRANWAATIPAGCP